MRVTGGGVNTSTGPDPSNNPRAGYSVQLSAPVDGILPSGIVPDGSPATGWYGSVYNLSGAAQDFKVFALCSRNTDATVEVTDGLIAPTGTGVGDRATCPAGTRLVGGGLHVPTGPIPLGVGQAFYAMNVSGPRDETGRTEDTDDGDVARSWYAGVINNTATTQNMRVYALCSRASDAVVEATTLTAPSGDYAVGTAQCPNGRRALGGGLGNAGGDPRTFAFELSGPLDETGLTRNTETDDPARSWYAAARNNAGLASPVRVFALCARERDEAGGGGGGGGGGAGGGGGGNRNQPDVRCLGRKATKVGTAGRDVLKGTRRVDVIAGLGGNDRIEGLRGDDIICAGAGNDVVIAGAGADFVAGGGGNDRLDGGDGNDALEGGRGRDRLAGARGRDQLLGGPGRDVLRGGPGRNRLKR